jgi:hypothetical protein
MAIDNPKGPSDVAIDELQAIVVALEEWQEMYGPHFSRDVTSVAAGALNQLLQSLKDQRSE